GDSQRHHRAPGPARHLVNVERKPGWQEHHLDRQSWHSTPGKLAEVGQEYTGKDLGSAQATLCQNELPGFDQRWMVSGITGQFESEIGLDRVAEMTGSSVEERPGTVIGLDCQQMLAEILVFFLIHPPHEVVEEDVLCVHGGVGLKGVVPISF